MAEKRKDSKGRILRDGENQMKDGRYRYQYMDGRGKRCAVYSWKLVETDRTPPGKRDDISLREKIKQIASYTHYAQIQTWEKSKLSSANPLFKAFSDRKAWILFGFSLVKNVNKLVGTEINNSVFLTLS